jgi:hypothetical protein
MILRHLKICLKICFFKIHFNIVFCNNFLHFKEVYLLMYFV